MFLDLRNKYGLTRPQLAELTGRSPNYILKAESLTFPTPPVALLSFYCTPNNTIPNWEVQDPDLLATSYRDAQRVKREQWLSDWLPAPSYTGRTFRYMWFSRWFPDYPDYPTEYRISQGLCIPAAAVYRAERKKFINTSILTALSDLAEYCLSGRYIADHGHEDEDPYVVIEGVLQIKKELEAK
jgi:transcriptional regulator with XRE-family HTH domain